MADRSQPQQITPALHLWHGFDPSVKTDLFSTAALVGHALFLVDPIPLAPEAWRELIFGRQLTAILITNANHVRASVDFARAGKMPVYCAPEAAGQFEAVEVVPLKHGMEIAGAASAISLDGAAPGEFAFHFGGDGGTMVVGDALIHLDPYGFSLLPAKYCQNQEELRRSLQQLLDWPFERLFFAHGGPLLSRARERLEALLQ